MLRFGGVDGVKVSLLPPSPGSGSLEDGTTIGGVGCPELLDGELSVHIRSRSLSDSSPLLLRCLPMGIVDEMASGLWVRLSGLGRSDGRRKRRNSGLADVSSGDVALAGLDGSANSCDDEGKDRRRGDCAMGVLSRVSSSNRYESKYV